MTEYEAASLALQQAALAAQQAALAAQQASVWVAAIVGAAQCSLIGYGLYIMRRAAIHRDALQHRESMTALRWSAGGAKPPASRNHEGAGQADIEKPWRRSTAKARRSTAKARRSGNSSDARLRHRTVKPRGGGDFTVSAVMFSPSPHPSSPAQLYTRARA